MIIIISDCYNIINIKLTSLWLTLNFYVFVMDTNLCVQPCLFFFSNRATMSLTTNDFHPKTRKIDLNSQVYALGLSDESFT